MVSCYLRTLILSLHQGGPQSKEVSLLRYLVLAFVPGTECLTSSLMIVSTHPMKLYESIEVAHTDRLEGEKS
jgi:hypothetical protein